jgi:15-cis-phytoene synthase
VSGRRVPGGTGAVSEPLSGGLPPQARPGWERALARLGASGFAKVDPRGQLIRPLIGYAGSPDEAGDPFWTALLAVQLAHEASLLHDDVIDQATLRRRAPTRVAQGGVAAALVEGDHLLTTGYRLAAETGSLAFAQLYARAVERTVAGERRQNEARGGLLSREVYEEIVLGKSGELLGCAAAAYATLSGDPRAADVFEAGRRIGLCYQMLDDLLDYCEGASSGKTPYTDFRRRLWTWPLAHLPGGTWPEDEVALRRVLRSPGPDGRAPLESALAELSALFDSVSVEAPALLARPDLVRSLLQDWLARARTSVARSVEVTPESSPTAEPVRLPAAAELAGFFERNSRSFSFAARLMPREERARVTDVYAFCRVTDDIADGEGADTGFREARLAAWLELCRRAYQHGGTGHPTLDRVLTRARTGGVPFDYVEALVEGMRMDLAGEVRFASMVELRAYTYRVASVVGLWLTRSWGVDSPGVLAAASELGHAMQLTNILRDVGEDWRAGRVYLPADLMAKHGVDEALLAGLDGGGEIPPNYRALLEEVMEAAETAYDHAFAAIPLLPPRVQGGVAVAADVYRGIHAAVRANGHDNLRRRARTGLFTKVRLASRALVRLRRARSTPAAVWAPTPLRP